MARTIADYVEDVRLQIPLNRRPAKGDVENCVTESLKRTSYAAMLAPYRPALETVVTLTLSSRDFLNRQTVALPATIIHESVRDGDVTHTDIGVASGGRLHMRPIAELTRVYSGSVAGFFAVDNGLLYAFKQGTAFAVTSNALSVRGVALLTDVANIPLEVEPFFVQELLSMAMGLPVEAAA